MWAMGNEALKIAMTAPSRNREPKSPMIMPKMPPVRDSMSDSISTMMIIVKREVPIARMAPNSFILSNVDMSMVFIEAVVAMRMPMRAIANCRSQAYFTSSLDAPRYSSLVFTETSGKVLWMSFLVSLTFALFLTCTQISFTFPGASSMERAVSIGIKQK